MLTDIWVNCCFNTDVFIPVGIVQYSLNGVSSSLTDVTLKARQQGDYNKHPVLLPLTTIQRFKHTSEKPTVYTRHRNAGSKINLA